MASIRISNKAVHSLLVITDREDGINTIAHYINGKLKQFCKFTIDNLLIHDLDDIITDSKENDIDVEINYPIMRLIVKEGELSVYIYTDYYNITIGMGKLSMLDVKVE